MVTTSQNVVTIFFDSSPSDIFPEPVSCCLHEKYPQVIFTTKHLKPKWFQF